MTGLATLVMKMSFKGGKNKMKAKKYDLLELSISLNGVDETGVYLLLDNFYIGSSCLKVLPMKSYCGINNEQSNIPALSMPKNMVRSYKKIKDESILYFVNNRNPHIKDALESFFKKNEKHRSRKNKECKI